MIYFGNQLDKISNNLNMLLNSDNIDFDILFNQISNIYFDKKSFQIMPYPTILTKIKNSKYFCVSNNLKNIEFPFLLGDIDKRRLYNRVEKFYYKLKTDFVLIFKEDKNYYYIYDSDIAPYIKISKKMITDNLSNIVVIKSNNKKIYFDKEILFYQNMKNIYLDTLIGSNAYLEIINILENQKLLSKNELSLYYSLRELTVLFYKLAQLSSEFDKNIFYFLQNELNLFDNIINSISYRENQKILIQYFTNLYKNRKELEEYAKKYSTKLPY